MHQRGIITMNPMNAIVHKHFSTIVNPLICSPNNKKFLDCNSNRMRLWFIWHEIAFLIRNSLSAEIRFKKLVGQYLLWL